MRVLCFLLALALAAPAYAEPPRPMHLTEGEARIWAGLSECYRDLKICRVERDQARNGETALEERIKELESRPPVVERRVPTIFWIIAGVAVAAAGTTGYVLAIARR